MTATQDRRGDPDTTDDANALSWDRRSVIRSRRGLPWWGATLLCLGLTVAGALGEQALTDGLGKSYQVCFALGAVAAVLAVRRRAVFGQMVQPPLVLAAVVPTVVLTASGVPAGSDLQDKALAVGTPLTGSFPAMAIVTAMTVGLGIVRYRRERAPATGSRGARPRTGEESGDRARRDRPPHGAPDDAERPRRPGPPPAAREPDRRPGARERPGESRAPAPDEPTRDVPARDLPAREQGGRPPRRRPPRPPEAERPRPDGGTPGPNAPRRTPPKGEEPPPRPPRKGGPQPPPGGPQGGKRPGRDEHPPPRRPPGPGRPGSGRPPREEGPPEGRR